METLNLKERRDSLGLTQKYVADYIGVTEATISRWESGNIKNMRRNRISKYAEVLKIDPSEFFDYEDEKKPTPESGLDPEFIHLANQLNDLEVERVKAYMQGLLDVRNS